MSDRPQNKRGLGRGLSALMGDINNPEQDLSAEAATAPGSAGGVRRIPIEKIEPNPDQPRQTFGEADLKELASSILQKGIVQPLIVRENINKPNSYEIVAGERRWRAAQLVSLHELPVIVREYSDEDVLEIAIIENVQRADLNPVDEAMAYRQLMDRFGHTQEKIAEGLSKSRSHIANLLRLLNLPGDVLTMLRDGELSAGHARALVTTDNPLALAREVVKKGLSVRETERLAKRGLNKPVKKVLAPEKSEKDADTQALEGDLSAAVGMQVQIDHSENGSGHLTIRYKDLEQLDSLCAILGGGR